MFFCLRKIYLPVIPTQRKIYLSVLPVQRRFWELCLNENAKSDMSATLPERFEGRTFALHRRSRRYSASRAIISPGGWGDNRLGVCGRLVRPQSPIPLFPLYVPSWTPGRPGGHSLSPAASLWPALLGRVLWMTASSIGPNSTAAGTGHHRPETIYGSDS